MKLVCISASQVPSSAANSIEVMKVCQALVQCGHEVQLLVPGVGGPAWEELSAFYGLTERFPIRRIPARPGWKRYDFCWRAAGLAKKEQAEAVYLWPMQAAFFCLMRNLPIFLELHDRPEGRLGPALFKLVLKQPGRKRFLPITRALKEDLERHFKFRFMPHQVVIAPSGVDLERYEALPDPASARRQLNLPERFTACYTGHLYPGRGMGLLVELAKAFPQLNFLWVGGRSADVETWRERIAAESVTNITLTGFVENSKLPLYQAAGDVLLMPYERTITGSSGGNTADYCSPMKMFEYMACQRPILSSDLPVIREVLNEANAVLCPPEEPLAWASALTTLLESSNRRQELALQARRDVQGFTWLERAHRSLAGFPDQEG